MKRWMLLLMMVFLPVAMTGCGGAASATGEDDNGTDSEASATSSGEVTIDGQVFTVDSVERQVGSNRVANYEITFAEEGQYENVRVTDSDPKEVFVSTPSGVNPYKTFSGAPGVDVEESGQNVIISGSIDLDEFDVTASPPQQGDGSVTVGFAVDNAFIDQRDAVTTFLTSIDTWERQNNSACGDNEFQQTDYPQTLSFSGNETVAYEWVFDTGAPSAYDPANATTVNDTYFLFQSIGYIAIAFTSDNANEISAGPLKNESYEITTDAANSLLTLSLENSGGNTSCVYQAQ